MDSKSILVIEDNALNIKLLKGLLGLEQYRIIEAADAETGMQLASKHRPDLILMDIQLPGMDGLEATQILKRDPATKEIPVIALTSYAMQGDEEKALKAGCDGYITKPIETRRFLDSIRRYFRNDRTERKPHGTDDVIYKSRILVVDDEPLNIKLLAANLPRDRYTVIEASSGEEALGKAIKDMPDLILLDVMMPGIDGYEVTRRLKADPQTAEVPVILITALGDRENRLRGLEAGAEEFLNKPVNTTELLARIQSMIHFKRYQEQLSIRNRSEGSFGLSEDRGEVDKKANELPLILLADDDERDKRIIRQHLSSEPYRILCAGDGEEVIRLAGSEDIDLILLDIILPGMDGFEVCLRLKKMQEFKDIQILVITCLQDLESKVKGIEFGADDFLVKPVEERELRIRVRSLLKKKAALDALQSRNVSARDLGMNDSLTGLYNHTYFKRFLDLEVKRSLRQRYPLALTMLRVDDFARHTEEAGHGAADALMSELARILKRNIREVDLAARYGKDVFAIAQPYADRQDTERIADRIRQVIRDHSFSPGDPASPGGIGISMGTALCPLDASSATGLIQNTEQRLYNL